MEPRSAPPEERVYRFGDHRLLPSRQSLLRGECPVRIGSRALDLLRLLVERPGELISKAELIGLAWPDTFVHEDNLKVNISALRRALGDTGAHAAYIATVPGRGYRFVATVQVERPASPAHPAAAEIPGLPPPSAIVGRQEDIARIAAALTERRFVTIVGPAGVGKTTVAMAALQQVARHYADGVRFVDLAAIGDPQLVTAVIASAIGAGGHLKDILVGIVDTLRGRRKLLILDNCEHVLRAASVVAEHLRATLPDIAILATSREPFGSRTETVYRLPPLPCPAPGQGLDHDAAMTFAAVELFVTRAGAATGFRMTDATAPSVASICRRLDGIPLALELAAPRIRAGDAPSLHGLLDDGFELLGYGPADAPLRQQTLLATLDWSYRLLSENEAAVLRLLSVFAGAFTLDDAIGVGLELGRPPEEIAGAIEGLTGKSLLARSFSSGMPRYRLLDATRSYAARRLAGAAEDRRVAAAHAAYLLGLFRRAETEWRWRVREEWTAAYARSSSDLLKALDWAFDAEGDPALGVRLTACAIPLWDELSSVVESARYVGQAMQSPVLPECEPSLRLRLATAQAWSLSYTERFEPGAEAAWRESLRLAELTGDIDYQLRALWGLGIVQCFCGQHRKVLVTLDRFAELAEREHDHSAAPAGERLRAITLFYLGQVRAAHAELKRLAQRYDTVAQRSQIARFQIDRSVGIRGSLSLVQWICGLPEASAATAEAALEGATSIGHVVSQSNLLVVTVIPIALWSGRIDAAEHHLDCLLANLNQREIAIWAPSARFFGGMIQHERGDPHGIDRMRIALAELEAANFMVRMPIFLAMLTEAALQQGRVDLARESIAAALRHMERQEEYWCHPELLRLHGLMQQRDGDAIGAQRSMAQAMRLANQSGALSYELRAAVELAGCWDTSGRTADAADLLQAICGRFEPAAETRDLVRARHMLDRLRRSARASSIPETLAG